MNDSAGEVFDIVVRAGRDAIRSVWRAREERESMNSAERELLALLELHPEHRSYWEGVEPTGEENPFLHLTLHRIVAQQLDAGDPPIVRQTYDRLLAGGGDSHETLHEIMKVLAVEMHRMAETRGSLDRERYSQSLEKLRRDELPN